MFSDSHYIVEDADMVRLIGVSFPSSGAPRVRIQIGDVQLHLPAAQLAAVRMACGEGLIDLKNAVVAPKLTEHEDGHSLRADQFDNEQERVA